MTIDTNRNVALGFAQISQENHHVLSAVSNLTRASGPKNRREVDDYTSEVGLIWLCEVLQRSLPELFCSCKPSIFVIGYPLVHQF